MNVRKAAAIAAVALSAAHAAEPNPPQWPDTVAVFSPDSADMQQKIDAAYDANGGDGNFGQFSDRRYAFLFKPGRYPKVDVPVGYYTQVLGLGQTPGETVFASEQGVYCQEGSFDKSGALSTFWRSAENFRNEATKKWYVGTGMTWAVSQAAPLRRVEVANDLCLFQYVPPIPDAGEASGGYLSGLNVGGAVNLGSQQQFFARDSTVGSWNGGVWNVVTTGVVNAVPTHCSNVNGTPSVAFPITPKVADKPFITIDAAGKYTLRVPQVQTNTQGYKANTNAKAIGFEQVYVTQKDDTAEIINAKLRAGLHIVVSPGIYKLDAPLEVNYPGQVVLGLGLATLVSAKQNPAIVVADVDDVRVAGLLLQAGAPDGEAVAPTLLQWGKSGKYAGKAAQPGVMSDIFARVGGPDGVYKSEVAVDKMVHVRSGNVIIDNAWLWRADHAATGVPEPNTNPVRNGLVVDADDVTAYGLAVEHANEDLVQWNGNNGATYFYQSELPYDASQSYSDKGFVGYRVADGVTSHLGYGLGVYSFFRDNKVFVKSGIAAPKALEKNFKNCLTVHLSGLGGIDHVINEVGTAVNASSVVQYNCPQ